LKARAAGHKLRALSSGAKDFIAKPFELVEVTTRIHNMLEQSVKALESLALYDALTGLPNRRLLIDRLRQAVGVSARTGDYGAQMFLDLDHFKALNDTLGHIEGDHLLQQVGVRLQACVRDGDSVARLGGDEFVVLLAALSRNAQHASLQAAAIARKILAAIQQTSRLKEASTHVSASIGVALFVGNACEPEELLQRADLAMYQAKW
jgi:diguanylate cyclase (GGDEF)-like protein